MNGTNKVQEVNFNLTITREFPRHSLWFSTDPSRCSWITFVVVCDFPENFLGLAVWPTLIKEITHDADLGNRHIFMLTGVLLNTVFFRAFSNLLSAHWAADGGQPGPVSPVGDQTRCCRINTHNELLVQQVATSSRFYFLNLFCLSSYL